MIVADTNVILRGVRSNRGASGFILQRMLTGEIIFAASPAVILEYEDVLKRPGALNGLGIGYDEVDLLLDALCYRAHQTSPWFRFRPFLVDPKDDLFIECALAAGARTLVTDDRHFRQIDLAIIGLHRKTVSEFVTDFRNERKNA
jgi:predicted nucleic acid-binding protein